MTDIAEFLRQGTANAWFIMPSAVLLGALHGLEPGHSKTMMMAFIVAIRGTVAQAVLLGLAATVSHTAVVWVIALAGLHFGAGWNTERTEPYLQLASAVLIIGVAVWMAWRTWSEQRAHDHHHHDHGLDVTSGVWADSHERAHAEDIQRRFADRRVTTGQLVVFGLTGGLIPCPASITVLLVCLQLKQVTLGAMLVLCFSIGLAVTMVAVGAVAALSARHVSARWSGFGTLARRAPYLSSILIVMVGLYMGYAGLAALTQQS